MYRKLHYWLPCSFLAFILIFSAVPAHSGFIEDLVAENAPKKKKVLPYERVAVTYPQEALVNPFAPALKKALEFFTPLEGNVLSVQGDVMEVSLAEGKTAIEGMRMGLFRKGEPFLHPVTKQIIVQSETSIGMAEVTATGQGSATLRLIEGEVAAGDVVRITSGRLRALFYQHESVDWDVAEEYFFWLKDSGRFAIAETPPGNASDEEIAEIARGWDATVAVVIRSVGTPVEPRLQQTLMWVNDSKVFSAEETLIKAEELTTLKLGKEYFAPDRNNPTITFKVPFTATLIASGDIDGDGEQEILLADGSSVHFMSAGASLVPAFKSRDEVVLKGEIGQVPVWLETADLDHDGADEVLLTALRGRMAISSIYDFRDGKFTLLWEGQGFIRAIGKTVYIQPSDPDGGFMGSPSPLDWQGGSQAGAYKHISIPDGLDIYNFAILKERGQPLRFATFNSQRKLAMLSASGQELWASQDPYNPFNRSYLRDTLAEENEEETWVLNDRLVGIGEGIYTFRRISYNNNINAKGLGHSETLFMGIFPSSEGIRENILIKKMRGSSIDFTIAGNKLYVLAESFIPNPMNIFKGKKIFSSKLTVYLLGGKKQ